MIQSVSPQPSAHKSWLLSGYSGAVPSSLRRVRPLMEKIESEEGGDEAEDAEEASEDEGSA